ncbi:hypothetical protein GCM10022255_114010 [Dactylosporangium darangshiense]|uniref:Uncharacterized protein n=1 Tax=Dactylosporangium darangshiense TaxID=579108 RepID=A0ABP8DVH4_9ACTN
MSGLAEFVGPAATAGWAAPTECATLVAAMLGTVAVLAWATVVAPAPPNSAAPTARAPINILRLVMSMSLASLSREGIRGRCAPDLISRFDPGT